MPERESENLAASRARLQLPRGVLGEQLVAAHFRDVAYTRATWRHYATLILVYVEKHCRNMEYHCRMALSPSSNGAVRAREQYVQRGLPRARVHVVAGAAQQARLGLRLRHRAQQAAPTRSQGALSG